MISKELRNVVNNLLKISDYNIDISPIDTIRDFGEQLRKSLNRKDDSNGEE